jgi:hypothetical protein
VQKRLLESIRWLTQSNTIFLPSITIRRKHSVAYRKVILVSARPPITFSPKLFSPRQTFTLSPNLRTLLLLRIHEPLPSPYEAEHTQYLSFTSNFELPRKAADKRDTSHSHISFDPFALSSPSFLPINGDTPFKKETAGSAVDSGPYPRDYGREGLRLKNRPKVHAVELDSSGILKGPAGLSPPPLLPITAHQYHPGSTSSYPRGNNRKTPDEKHCIYKIV